MKTWMRWMAAAVLLVVAVAGCGDDGGPLMAPDGPSFDVGDPGIEEPCNGIDSLCIDDGYFGSGHTKPPPDTSSAGSGPSNPG